MPCAFKALQLQRFESRMFLDAVGRSFGTILGTHNYAARAFDLRREMTRANSVRLAPIVSSVFISRSMETDGSPTSILAIRDWLDPTIFAS